MTETHKTALSLLFWLVFVCGALWMISDTRTPEQVTADKVAADRGEMDEWVEFCREEAVMYKLHGDLRACARAQIAAHRSDD